MSVWKNLKRPFKAKNLKEEELLENDAFCMMPWVHFHVTQYGTVTPCCNAPWEAEHAFGNINESRVDELWNSDGIKAFRNTLRKGKKDARCSRCYEKDESGWLSLRKITNEKYKHQLGLVHAAEADGTSSLLSPIYLDLRFSNVCNLKCRICGPWASSRWHEDAIAMGWKKEDEDVLTYSIKDTDALFSQLEPIVEHLEEIYFAGGEPLVMEEHYRLLELLIAKKRTDIQLSYNTNFTNLTFKGRSVLDLWEQFPKINLAMSLDGSGERAAYMRSLSKWNVIEQNLEALHDRCPNVEVIISSTLSVFNLFHLPNFHKQWVEEGKINVEDVVPTMLMDPKHFNIRILPKTLKDQAVEVYARHINWMEKQPVKRQDKFGHAIQQFKNVIPHLESADTSALLPTFRAQVAKLDAIRSEDIHAVFPELESILNAAK